LVKKYSSKPKGRENIEAFKRHVEEHWHFNTILMDKEWYAYLEEQGMFDVAFDLFESINGNLTYDEVSNKSVRPDRLFEHIKPFSWTLQITLHISAKD